MSRYSGSVTAQIRQEALASVSPRGENGIAQDLGRARLGNMDAAVAALEQAEKLIDSQRRRIAYLETIAMSDEVTGLLNRRGFTAALQRELASAKRDAQAHGLVLMLDLDRFRRINAMHDHAAGDAYLAAFGAALVRELRCSDMVARLGGDEFAVLLTRTAPKTGMARAGEIIRKINGRHMNWRDHVLPFSASMGLATYGGRDIAEAVLVSADLRLYAEKQRRRKGGADAP